MSCHTDTQTHRNNMHMFPESALIQLGIAWELIFLWVLTCFDSPKIRPARDLKLGNQFSRSCGNRHTFISYQSFAKGEGAS